MEDTAEDLDIGKEFTVYSKDLFHDVQSEDGDVGDRFFPSSGKHGYYIVKIIKRVTP